VSNLKTGFEVDGERLLAVNGVSFEINGGETFCLVGESGCGKSVTSLTLMGLLDGDNSIVEADELRFADQNLLELSKEQYRKIRGRRVAMIFQEPMTALNPVYRVGEQVAEVFEIHEGMDSKEATSRAMELFEKVKIPDPQKRFYEYPHELSGGMKQRVMIAMALACRPELLIADEPTTALDVTVQAQILHLLQDLQKNEGTAVLFITHDLSVVAQIADRVGVMYSGKIVEQGGVHQLFSAPAHPYTKALLASIPSIKSAKSEELYSIPGTVPSINNRPSGCVFRTRCSFAQSICAEVKPESKFQNNEHQVSCHFPLSQEQGL
jgi:oligopeptide/dipeptide ABC transporter ATP-binding protein